MFRVSGDNAEEERNTLQTHATDLDLPVFNETSAVTIQPVSDLRQLTRRAIPVSTIDWQTTNVSQFVPLTGLDFLTGAEQLLVQQTIELHDLLSNVESENRYTIKVPRGETLYYASESSTSCHRMCFGTTRAFIMRLYDQTQQEAMQFRRRLACGGCIFCCYLQVLEVWIPPGELIGVVQQQTSPSTPSFLIYSKDHDVIYRIEGPTRCACTSLGKDAHFKVYSPDGMTQVGSINHLWDQLLADYHLCIQFPGRSVDSKHKALLLGAAFLLEYMYYQSSRLSKYCTCL
ncbi:hypothetical protein FQR65_LT10060 [Abscondita terminalis]|nr:hypothetical protein FQR65_LT10060 [Abscondita terminalis]